MENYEKFIRPQSPIKAKITALEVLERVVNQIDRMIEECDSDIMYKTHERVKDDSGNFVTDDEGNWIYEPLTTEKLEEKYSHDTWQLQNLEDSYYEKRAFLEIKKTLMKNI